MGTTFEYASEVRLVAAHAIERWHPDLWQSDIRYVFRVADDPWTKSGKFVYAKVSLVNGVNKLLAEDADAVIVVDQLQWRALSRARRLALIDHELCHLEIAVDGNGERIDQPNGRPKLALREHDFADFNAVVQRHGLWSPDLGGAALSLRDAQPLDRPDDVSPDGERVAEALAD